jgi:uncharacterized protein YbjT (DUF2867 family)
MILIVGASGALGSIVAGRLVEKGDAVRGMSRSPAEKLAGLQEKGAEVIQGDLRDSASLLRACDGATKVVAAAHSIFGRGDERSELVDDKGHRDLIDAASEAGVQHFVYISVIGASPDHLSRFARHKYEVEQYLKASGLPYTIIRASCFMCQVHELIGEPVLETGKVRLFGKGESTRNFVDERDVAACVLMALQDGNPRGTTMEIGGPENLTTVDVVTIYEQLSGRRAEVSHVPQGALRVLSSLLRPFHPGLSQVMALSLHEDVHGSYFDATPFLKRYPLKLRSVEEYVRARVSGFDMT